MRTGTTILLMVLALGLLVAGCSKTTPTETNIQTPTDSAVAGDIVVDTTTGNPDIGALDDTAVSDGLPQ